MELLTQIKKENNTRNNDKQMKQVIQYANASGKNVFPENRKCIVKSPVPKSALKMLENKKGSINRKICSPEPSKT